MTNEATTTEAPLKAEEAFAEGEQEELEKMLEAGVHFGHKRSMWNPSMGPYVHTIRRNIFIIDVRKTEEMLQEALQVIEDTVASNGNILIVGTQPAAKAATESFADDLNIPHVTRRWIGGTFTNFSTISQRTTHLRDLEERRASGQLEKYTKLEQVKFDEEIERLNRKVGGIKNMKKLPQLIIVLNVVEDDIAVREARRAGVPVVGLVDTNADPTVIDYPIPANDDVPSAVQYVLDRFRGAIEAGRERAKKEAAAEKKRKEKEKAKKKAKKAKAKKKAAVVDDAAPGDIE